MESSCNKVYQICKEEGLKVLSCLDKANGIKTQNIVGCMKKECASIDISIPVPTNNFLSDS
jgi:hypothetical protein